MITFHSLEDRIVKQTLAAGAATGRRRRMPVPLPEHGRVLRLLTRGGEAADRGRDRGQPAGGSARVRAAERIRGRHERGRAGARAAAPAPAGGAAAPVAPAGRRGRTGGRARPGRRNSVRVVVCVAAAARDRADRLLR